MLLEKLKLFGIAYASPPRDESHLPFVETTYTVSDESNAA
jgi:hypothetical protein